MAKPAKEAPEEAEASAKPKGKKILLAAVGILLLGALGGGAWFFLSGNKHEEKKEEVKETPVFVPLESFTVNLQREEGDQFLQVGITLKLSGAKIQEKVVEHLPEIRSRLLFLLSSKRPSELVPVEGKKKLAKDIAQEVNVVMGFAAPREKKAAQVDGAASGVGFEQSAGEASPAASAAEAVAPVGKEEAVGSGVIDVLFTSFIIQ